VISILFVSNYNQEGNKSRPKSAGHNAECLYKRARAFPLIGSERIRRFERFPRGSGKSKNPQQASHRSAAK